MRTVITLLILLATASLLAYAEESASSVESTAASSTSQDSIQSSAVDSATSMQDEEPSDNDEEADLSTVQDIPKSSLSEDEEEEATNDQETDSEALDEPEESSASDSDQSEDHETDETDGSAVEDGYGRRRRRRRRRRLYGRRRRRSRSRKRRRIYGRRRRTRRRRRLYGRRRRRTRRRRRLYGRRRRRTRRRRRLYGRRRRRTRRRRRLYGRRRRRRRLYGRRRRCRTFNLNVRVFGDYGGTEFKEWFQKRADISEEFFKDKPALKIHTTYVRTSSYRGQDLTKDFEFKNVRKFKKWMDKYFDVHVISRTRGWFPILVVKSIKIGDKTYGGYSSFPFIASPFDRRYGIIMTRTTGKNTLAHEFGHRFGLIHTFGRRYKCNRKDGYKKDKYCVAPSLRKDGSGNLMDYCNTTDHKDYTGVDYLTSCQKKRAAGVRRRLLTRKCRTKYRKLRGWL